MSDKFKVVRRCGGFTLIEMLIVIVILGIMAAVAIPGFAVLAPRSQLKAAARDLVSNFQKIKIEAIKRNITCSITFNQPVDSVTYDYVCYVDSDEDLEYDSGEVVITKMLFDAYESVSIDLSKDDGDGLSFADNSSGRPATGFRPNGLPRNAGTAFLKNTRNETMQVVVSPAGNIRIP